jgi:2-polyprenyl-3-methyl-5-hydroxy-6-metoxy-1,4-benzoquinol methylase
MTRERESWDRDYKTRDRLWGGFGGVMPDIPVGSHVLEVGCGNGKTLRALLSSGLEVTAIDFSSRAVTLCRHYILKSAPVSVAQL